MKGKKVRLTEHGVKISQGRVVSVSDKNLSPFEQLALVTYPKLYYIDAHGRLQKRKNAESILEKGVRPHKRRGANKPDKEHELGSKPVSKTLEQRKKLHKERMASADVARAKLDKARAEMRERYLLKKQAGMLARQSEEASHSLNQAREEGERTNRAEESTSDTRTADVQNSSGQGTEGTTEDRIQRPDSDGTRFSEDN